MKPQQKYNKQEFDPLFARETATKTTSKSLTYCLQMKQQQQDYKQEFDQLFAMAKKIYLVSGNRFEKIG